MRLLRDFVRKKLKTYGKERNHPELDKTSRLSPYFILVTSARWTCRAVRLRNADARAKPIASHFSMNSSCGESLL
jgi:deoxyribodipyrimidine photolyase